MRFKSQFLKMEDQKEQQKTSPGRSKSSEIEDTETKNVPTENDEFSTNKKFAKYLVLRYCPFEFKFVNREEIGLSVLNEITRLPRLTSIHTSDSLLNTMADILMNCVCCEGYDIMNEKWFTEHAKLIKSDLSR